MDRDTAIEVMNALGEIEKLLDDCPHGVAKKIKDKLSLIEGVAEDAFPGGYDTSCIYCDEPMGHEESVSIGDEKCCPSCWAKRVEEMRTCEHKFEDGTDDFGDPERVCGKCGAIEICEKETA